MIQDITPHDYRNEYRPVKPEKESYMIICKQKYPNKRVRTRDFIPNIWRTEMLE